MFLEIAPMQEAEMILGSNNCCYGNCKVTYQNSPNQIPRLLPKELRMVLESFLKIPA
jgi:hypothetical protein